MKKRPRSQEFSQRLTKALLCLWAKIGNPDRTRNPSDCRIRYRALREKIQGFTTRGVIFLPKGSGAPPPPTPHDPNPQFYFLLFTPILSVYGRFVENINFQNYIVIPFLIKIVLCDTVHYKQSMFTFSIFLHFQQLPLLHLFTSSKSQTQLKRQ